MDIRRRLLKRVDELAPAVLEVSRFIHAHPELGFEEKACSAFLRGKLAALGFRVERPLKSLPTAFVASSGAARPAVGFVSEYDALPEIGHG
ncbi:MAG TPA: amidohydrolase, partial [Elusimicrobia bacterium]|nr:amidohydrolase [Elusimicrobiota bacterium]